MDIYMHGAEQAKMSAFLFPRNAYADVTSVFEEAVFFYSRMQLVSPGPWFVRTVRENHDCPPCTLAYPHRITSFAFDMFVPPPIAAITMDQSSA